jgi:serine/threonine-protein kinase HipA
MNNYCICCLKEITDSNGSGKNTELKDNHPGNQKQSLRLLAEKSTELKSNLKDNQKQPLSHPAYHSACIKKLFGTSGVIPSIHLKSTELLSEITKNAGSMSISGVQIKALVKVNKISKTIEFVQSGGTHILKPQPGQYPELPQNENLCMCLAEDAAGFDVPPHGLFYMADGKICYIIKRFDKDPRGQKIHMEDMAQLLEMPPDSKYESSLEKVGNAILKFSSRPYLDLIDFFERILFCFLTGNGDMHLKNWSLIERPANYWRMAPCYDLISSKVYLPGEDESALTLNGKRNRLNLDDFICLGSYLKIDNRSIKNAIDKMKGLKEKMIAMISGPNYFSGAKDLGEIVLERYARITQK